MMKFKALQFVASISADMAGEFDSLEEMITANKAGEDNASKIENTYCHLGSLIQGMEYMAEFIADEDDEKELAEVLKDLRNQRDNFYPRAASIIYTKRLGKPVEVTIFRHSIDATDYLVRVYGENYDETKTFSKTDEVKEYIKSLEA